MSRPRTGRRLICRLAWLALVVCALGVVTSAQVTSGTIFGTAKDSSGAFVRGANVTVTNPATGVKRTLTTSDDGDFVAPNLPPGTYNITVEAAGFRTLEKTNIVLSAADRLNAGDFVLAVGAIAESVTVSADAGQLQLQSNSGERSDLITSKQLNDVALNGRNVLDYMKLIPGVTSTFSGAVSGTGGIDGFNVNGTRANQHEFTLDGASNVDTGNNGGTHVTLNPDAIEEVKVLTSNYQAEFGKAAGGQVAVVTKSGTNAWHGNARFFHRHEGLNANEWFNKHDQLNPSDPVANPPHNDPKLYRYNDIGYQIGGPVLKDKVFVFWSQEFYRQLIPTGGTIRFYTPTQLERQGDFSQSTDGSGRPVLLTGPGITNNVIDRSQLPAAQQAVFDQVQKILNLYPVPNVSGFGVNNQDFNYSTSLSAEAPRREDILRLDYQLNSKNRLYGRWIHNSETDTAPFVPFPGPFGIFACSSSVNFPGGCTQKHPGWNLSLNWVSTIRPTLLNEFSVGPSHTLTLAEGASGNISRGANGIDLPLLFPVSPDQSIPDMHFNDLPGVSFGSYYLGGTPWKQANTTINVNDNLTWVRNNHTLKAGLFYQRNRKDQIAWENINGEFNFGPGPTAPATCPGGPSDNSCMLGDPLASALIGEFQSFDQTTARLLGKFRYNQLEFYVQDTWKVFPRLTLDYGVRFAWIPPQYDANNNIALFDPSAYNPANAVTINPSDGNIIVAAGGDPLNGMRFTADGGLPKGGWNSRGIMPEPRFGFALDVLGDHKTVLRGGFAMMHDRVQGNLIFSPVFRNPALVQKPSVSSDNIANLPTLSISPTEIPTQGDGAVVGASRDGKVPTVYSFSFGVQRELGKGTTLDLAYVGTLSRHLVTGRDINAVPYGTAFTRGAQDPANFTDYCSNPAPTNPCTNGLPNVEPGLPAVYANAGFNFSGAYAFGHQAYTNTALVPFKGYGQIPYLKFDGTGNYNSLQASFQRRFTRGLTVGAVYTWSKALATANSDEDWQDPFNVVGLGYRLTDFDRTHVFAANYVYDLPNFNKHFGGPKWLSYITDNYQLSGVVQAMTGSPVRLGSWKGEPGSLDGGNMWGIVPYFYTLDAGGNPVIPPLGTRIRGTQLRTGGLHNWDMSLFKNIPFGERYSVQLRLEAFNVFNHPNFNNKFFPTTGNQGAGLNFDGPFEWTYPGQAGAGSGTPNFTMTKASNFGQNADTYNSSGGPGGFRVVQLAAKFYF